MFSNKKFFRLSATVFLSAMLTIFVESTTAQSNKLPIGVNVGNLVGSTLNGTMSIAQVNQLIQKKFGSSVSPTAQALDLYKISYGSRDEKNRTVVLLSLINI